MANPQESRMTFQELFMKTALLYAKRSTCCKLQTGSVLVKDNAVISTGYNGVVGGAPHCCDYWHKLYCEKYQNEFKTFEEFKKSDEFKKGHHEWSLRNELHGEQNCILRAHKKARGSDLFTVFSPCINCAKCCVTCGIKKIYYLNVYNDLSGIEFCKENNIECIHLTNIKL